MPETNIDPNQNPPTEPVNFVKKTIETPILDSGLREQINDVPQTEPGLKGFYQANKFYFWAILVGVIIIGVLSYFAFKKTPPTAPKEAKITISTDVPETIPSGSVALYKITIQNDDNQKLVNSQLEVTYAEGMVYDSSVPKAENLSGTQFKVPDLIPGQNIALFIKIRVNGNVNDQKTLNYKLHYHYNNFSSEFTKDSSSTVRLIASNVVINLTGPDTTNNAQLVLYNISFQNNADTDIKNARIKMHYPDGFNYASGSPSPDLGNDTWTIDNLPKNATSTITVQGTFASSNPGESKTATVDFLILGQDGNYFIQNTASVTTNISSLPLLVTQVVTPIGNNSTANPGDMLSFSIKYQNNGSTAATGVNIEADLDSKVIDPTSIRAEGGQINNNSIIWNASGVPKLASLGPNQGGQLSFTARINNPASKDSSKNLTVISNLQIKSNEYSTSFPGNQITIKISSPSTISSSLNYLSGQMPPQVGKSTKYQVNIMLNNSSNDFVGGTLTAFIPLASGGFEQGSVNQAEAQNVQFDPSTGKLTWNFAGLLANTGRFSAAKTLTFNVTLNPSTSQASQSVVLIKDITMSATDVFTQNPVTINGKNISTSDIQGQNGFSSGSVQP